MTMTAEESARVINSAYDEAVHFRPNTFDVPNGSGGKEFVNLLSQYLLVFGNAGTYQGQALKIAMLFQMLLLQKPFQSNPSSYAKCLKRRLELWRVGAIPKLMEEFRTIHEQLAKHQQRHEKSNPDGAKRFASLVTEGKLGTALAHLEEDASMGVLNLDDRIGNDTVRDILTAKHPPAAPAHPVAISQGDLWQFALGHSSKRRHVLFIHVLNVLIDPMVSSVWSHNCRFYLSNIKCHR